MILVRESDRAEAEKRKKTLLIRYIVILCVYLAAALLLILLSPDSYVPFMIADIVITVAFGWYSIYFFTVQYDFQVKWTKLLYKVQSALTESVYAVFVKEDEKKTVDGIVMRILIFSVRGSDREFHLLQENLTFEKDKVYHLVIQAGVITEIGERDEEDAS